MFARAASKDAKLQATLNSVVFYHLDAEKGEGPDLAKKYNIKGYPTFVVMDAEGALLNRWWGYRSPRDFAETVALATTDPMPVPAREARFKEKPTAHDAALLARVRLTDGDNKGAAELYAQAAKLNTKPAVNYAWEIFDVRSSGYPTDFPYDQLKESADAALAVGSPEPGALADLAAMMVNAGKEEKKPVAEWAPYLKTGLKASEGSTDDEVVRTRRFLLVDHALHVEKDKQKALQYQRETFTEGWETRPGSLNRFAWWCFENDINIEEAETMAAKGVDLAKPGRQKAMILDTLAEICRKRGKMKDAVAMLEKAAQEDPKNEEYPKKLAAFKATPGGTNGSH